MKKKQEQYLELKNAELENELAAIKRDLEIEASLELVRAQAMSMARPDELLGICEILFTELEKLGFNEIRNSQIFIYNDHKGSFMNYGFSVYEGPAIAEIYYNSHPKVNAIVTAVRKTNDAFAELSISGDELKAWRDYRIENGEPDDPRLANINSLYYYFYSIGVGAIGISNFESISARQLKVLKRFRNVFDFAYRRYQDVAQAEALAREAQIELGLERVRARAMAMRDSKELSGMVSTVLGELTKLDFALTRCAIVIADNESRGRMIWMANSEAGQPPISFYRKSLDHPYPNAANEEWKKRTPKWVYHLKGAEKKAMDHYYANSEEVAHMPSAIRQAMDMPESIILSHSFNNFGYLRTDSLEPLSEANLDILYRFAKVFEMCYTRFTDIKQAETQAREAQIELALERVRAKTMAMQHSDELMETSQVLFQQLRDLGETADQLSIGIVKEEEGVFDVFATVYGAQFVRVAHPKIDDPFVMGKVYQNWKAHKKSFVIEISGDDLLQYNRTRNQLSDQKYYNENVGPEDRWIVTAAGFSRGILSFSSSTEPSGQVVPLLERFAKVFEQTYTRFLDLKKAEAQAREGQIEAALERVRSRSMAMQKSDELQEIIKVVYEQLAHLNILVEHAGFIMDYNTRDDMHIWLADKHYAPTEITVPYFDSPHWNGFNEAKQKGSNFFAIYSAFEEKNRFYQDLFKLIPGATDETKEYYLSCPGLAISTVLLENVGLYIENFAGTPYTDDENSTLMRFGKVFQQTYTRFLDLKHAEEQARESQIQLALERIRARTMAMQKSEELAETVSLLFKQLLALGIRTEQIRTCGIVTFDNKKPVGEQWVTETNGEVIPQSFMVPYNELPAYLSIYEAWKKGEKFKVVHLKGELLKQHFRYLDKHANVPVKDMVARRQAKEIYNHVLFFSQGYLFIITKEALPEYHEVFKRFGAVFQQSYTRFLDLQKAEAQAREAQIELALERVRAKTMAMHNSEDVGATVAVMFDEMVNLGVDKTSRFGIGIIHPNKEMEVWTATSNANLGVVLNIGIIDMMAHPLMEGLFDGWSRKQDHHETILVGEDVKSYYRAVNATSCYTAKFDIDSLPSKQYHRSFIFPEGALYTFSPEPLTQEVSKIATRFANVFSQTYRRYRDLQIAETQAREAQIQLALERVRARTMAMQKSDELAETVSLLFKQLLALGIRTEQIRTCGIVTFTDNEPMGEQWITETNGEIIPHSFMVPYNEAPAYKAIYNGWMHGEEFIVIHLEGEKLKEHLGYLAKGTNVPTRDVVLPQQAKEIFNHVMFFSQGCLFIITKEALPGYHDVFKRFGAVFQQSYTRFLDLKKAEAQAMEAQIEAALERVRSRTMAMQKSEELKEVIQLVYEQLKQLNFNIDSANFALDYKESDDFNLWLSSAGQSYPTKVHTPYVDLPIFNRFIEAKKNGVDFLTENYSFEEKNAFFDHFFKNVQGVTDERKEFVMGTAGYARSTVLMKNVTLSMQNYAAIPYSEEENAALRRFGKVFEQTYTRFLDLQQAEAQAREAKIEAGLERVRAKAMSMQKSEELNALISTVFNELTKLDVVLTRCLIMIFDPETKDSRWWMANSEAPEEPMNYYVQYHKHPANAAYLNAWKERTLKWRYDLKGKVKKTWDDFLFVETELSHMPDFVIDGMKAPDRVILSASFNNFGCLTLVSLEPLSDEHFDLLLRFAKVFDMSYTRFNDLKQAEAQTREAKIEAALERVRSRAMSMQKSEDLAHAVAIIFEELDKLDLGMLRCGIGILDKEKCSGNIWTTTKSEGETVVQVSGDERMDIHPLLQQAFDAWANQDEDTDYVLEGEDLNDFYKALTDTNFKLPDSQSIVMDAADYKQYYYVAVFQSGGLYAFRETGFTFEAKTIMRRFADVFDFTYTRFSDLKQAEAQAREAKIEAALERVRSRTMAMFKSDELAETASVLFQQFEALGIMPERIFIGVIKEHTRKIDFWGTEQGGNQMSARFEASADGTVGFSKIFDAFNARKKTITIIIKGDELDDHVRYIREVLRMPIQLELIHQQRILYNAFFSKGLLMMVTNEAEPKETLDILERFAGVFNLTYTRFLDLQKAEAQAREAQIEASLERVRSKAMSMRDSNGLLEAASTVFIELQHLGINQIRSGVGLITKDFHKAKVYSATSSQNAIDLSLMGEVTLYGHPVFEQQYQSWLKRENYFVALEGKELASYYKILSAGLNANLGITVKKNQKEYGHWFMFSEGFLYAWSDKEYTDAEIRILERFKNVMELTIRRYIELQNSETQAREAVRQASLDRVRAEIASMRSISDLDRITPLIWNELTILGVPFIRCGVFIMDEQHQLIHTYLSTPDGKAIAAFQLPFNSESGNRVNGAALRGWREKQVVTLHWTEDEFRNFSHSLVEQGEITSEENYLTGDLPTGLDLHFFPFLQGMLYAGNTAPLADDEKDLVQSLADAFSTAYARYEDFNRLDTAKQEVERTLTDLRTAQTRLIQSEKMASLGELTAGIAHEIQNPLNFVNNFSEVNKEMLEELKAESEKPKAQRDEQLEIELINDLIKNEEKINHHGKRADGIVKGMLQHSRTAGGEKLPTNINSVAEEYMRLSYHGLRAKDKSFNAEMVMNFDPGLPRVEAVGQDIGRVFLNLFNNAFYAVNQKMKTVGNEYKPEVSVSTSKENGQVIIKVKDNGVGMPDHVKDKIMQPFFTTKPTGEGTGLGLSLTYDMVVKGHGGSILVNSAEGEGSEFIIALPIN